MRLNDVNKASIKIVNVPVGRGPGLAMARHQAVGIKARAS